MRLFVFTQDRKLPVVCLMCNPLYLTLLISISKSKAISAPKRAFAILWAFWCKGLSSRGLPRYRLGHMIWVMFSTLPALLELEDTGGWVAWLPKSWRWFEASNFPLMKSSYNIPYHFSSSWLKTLGTTKKPWKITFHNFYLIIEPYFANYNQTLMPPNIIEFYCIPCLSKSWICDWDTDIILLENKNAKIRVSWINVSQHKNLKHESLSSLEGLADIELEKYCVTT